ncbi:MAG: pilus assembly protein [Chloroflexota bacterium]|nr:pilus assembly protein [Chloroflexota bacterium]
MEFALTIGLFILVVGGVFQFAAIVWSQNTISQVARDTARWAATQSASPCDPNMRGPLTATANALATKSSLMGHSAWATAPGVDAAGPNGIGVGWSAVDPPPLFTPLPTDCPPSDNRLVWVIEVRVNHSVPIFMPGLQFIAPACGAPGFCISSSAELRMEPKRPE